MGKKNKNKKPAASTAPTVPTVTAVPEVAKTVEVKPEVIVEQKEVKENVIKQEATPVDMNTNKEEKVEVLFTNNENDNVGDKENTSQEISKSKKKRNRRKKNKKSTENTTDECEESLPAEPPSDGKVKEEKEIKENMKSGSPIDSKTKEIPQVKPEEKLIKVEPTPSSSECSSNSQNPKKNNNSSNNNKKEKETGEKVVKNTEKVEAPNNDNRKSKSKRRGGSKKCIPDELQERLEREQKEARDQLKSEIEKREKLLEKIEMVLDCKKQEKKIAKDHQESLNEMVALTSLANSASKPLQDSSSSEKDQLVDKIEQVLDVTKLEIKNVQHQQAFVGRLENELSKIKQAKNNYLQGETSTASPPQSAQYKLPEHIEKLKKGIRNVEEVKSRNKEELLKEIESRDVLMAEINKVLDTTKTEIQNVQKQQKIIANLETELHRIKEAEISEKLMILSEDMKDDEEDFEEQEKVKIPAAQPTSSSLLDALMANVGKIKDMQAQKQQQKENDKKAKDSKEDNEITDETKAVPSEALNVVIKETHDRADETAALKNILPIVEGSQVQRLSMADMLKNAPNPGPEVLEPKVSASPNILKKKEETSKAQAKDETTKAQVKDETIKVQVKEEDLKAQAREQISKALSKVQTLKAQVKGETSEAQGKEQTSKAQDKEQASKAQVKNETLKALENEENKAALLNLKKNENSQESQIKNVKESTEKKTEKLIQTEKTAEEISSLESQESKKVSEEKSVTAHENIENNDQKTDAKESPKSETSENPKTQNSKNQQKAKQKGGKKSENKQGKGPVNSAPKAGEQSKPPRK